MITDVGRVYRISNLFTCPLDSLTELKIYRFLFS